MAQLRAWQALRPKARADYWHKRERSSGPSHLLLIPAQMVVDSLIHASSLLRDPCAAAVSPPEMQGSEGSKRMWFKCDWCGNALTC